MDSNNEIRNIFKRIIDDGEEEKKIREALRKRIEKENEQELINKLKEIDIYNEEDVYSFILVNLKVFIRYLNNQEIASYLYYNINIAKVLYDVISEGVYRLSDDDKIKLNNLFYNFLLTQNSKKDKDYLEKCSYIYKISYIINYDIEYRLNRLDNISSEFASKLAITRYSADLDEVNVRRINFLIFSSLSPDLTTEEEIKEIYNELFYDKFDDTFIITMFDVYNNNEEWYTKEMSEVDSILTNALLYILNDNPKYKIIEILTKYSDECITRNANIHMVRTSVINISMDFANVVNSALELKSNGKFIL